jgi:hypothetical protein
VDRDALDRARRRIAVAGAGGPDLAEIDATLEQTKAGLEALARTAAELEEAVPQRLESAIHEGMKTEVLPVARHIAEVRGLSAQIVGRLERLGGDLAAERKARLEDLALLVDLVASGWRGVERRLDRLERIMDRVERSLQEPPNAAVYRIDRGA